MHAPRFPSAERRRGLPIAAALMTALTAALVMASALGAAADPPAAKAAVAEPAAERVPAPKASPADGEATKRAADISGTKAKAGTADKADEAGKADKPGKSDTSDKSAADGRCDRCGSGCCVVKVCAPRCTTKEITKVSWQTECEDFCVPGRSRRCPDPCGRHACPCRGGGTWEPGCGSVRSREVLVKKTTKESKATVEWKVEERCGTCRGDVRCTAAGCTAGPGPTAGPTAGHAAGDTIGAALARLWLRPGTTGQASRLWTK